MKTLFNHTELPLSALDRLGVYAQDQLLLDPENIRALLSGRRTGLVSLQGIRSENLPIDRLDAKLSLFRNERGEAELLLHPIYRAPQKHPLLSDGEMSALIGGEKEFIGKSIQKEEGRSSMLNIEYDKETKEFITYDVSMVQAPDLVNGVLLSAEEKSAFSRGEVLNLPDGTQLRHTAAEPIGIRSDRKALILSVLLDGGISYLLLRDISPLKEGGRQLDYATPSFNSAYQDMEGQKTQQMQYNAVQSFPLPMEDRGRGLSR